MFIASDEDLEIPVMQGELRGKASFIRVFRWQWPSKKGWAGGSNYEYSLVNATWFYAWNGGDYTRTNQEYSPQRHHEAGSSYDGTTTKGAWPGWDEINGRDANSTHVLGNNEPDNTGDNREVYLPIDQTVDAHPGLFGSGIRIGCFATTSLNNCCYNAVYRMIELCFCTDLVTLYVFRVDTCSTSGSACLE